MMMMTIEFKNEPFPASAPPRGRLPARRTQMRNLKWGSRPPLSSYTRLDQPAVVQRRHTCINAHLPCDTINGEALLLLKIWRIHPVEISHLDGVCALCRNIPLLVV
jgi:hypothetical protein